MKKTKPRQLQDGSRPARPGQKTFRADPDLLTRLDKRAMMETAALGVEVAASDIIRRGLEWAMAQPLPGPSRSRCNIVKTASGGSICLACKEEADPGAKLYCGPEMQEAPGQ
jgi:hypothetical protein